ncbi:MAG TPA: hypothetical protein HA292_04230 [Candidatus Nitrosotenuis sp.]|jgi:hypothetical protein|nr:hypothetical protein [Candidatus Nitrosotenuis sp.]HIH46275.1 hypothetical protein [Candidatus Nitrosotenuis sp.]HII04090.1 hypothetical protein [Candidatus Nitrosotenuis sp.]
MKYELKIKNLDIQESYFVGKAELLGREYKINIQQEGRLGKAILLPSKEKLGQQMLVTLSGPEKFVEEFLKYSGESEWIEIDSDTITAYVADNQDKFDNLIIQTDLI